MSRLILILPFNAQQPFGGAILYGTNDKPGGPYNVLKWSSPLSVKEYNQPITTLKHSSML